MSKEIQCKCCKEYWWEMNIHSQSGLCPNCYDYVADLEAKLAESEERANRYKSWHNEKAGECEELKEQLAEKEKEIEEIKQIISKYTDKLPDNVAFDIANDDIRYQIVSNLIDKNTNYRNQIKELRQAKTDFAIEKLEKVKERILEDFDYDDLMYWLNKQIKELKEGK